MAATTELDSSLKQALNFLHSTNPQSAEDIRNCLDDIIKQRYGTAKMLANTISRKHLDEEPQAPGTLAIPAEVEDLTITQSPKTIDSPNTIAESDDMTGGLISEEVENLKEFGDLKCVVCGEMIVTATNRLIECSKCGSLYHQMCHNPNITDEEADEQELSWTCTNCQSKTIPTKAPIDESSALLPKAKSSSASSSRSSSSSTSSSPYYRQEHSSSSSSKHHKGSSSTKSHSSKEPSVSTSKSSSSASVVTPSINVVSAEKSYSSKKSSSHSSSSSKSKSRHHESSSSGGGSSKRKSSK